jgi:hypothetical protein
MTATGHRLAARVALLPCGAISKITSDPTRRRVSGSPAIDFVAARRGLGGSGIA